MEVAELWEGFGRRLGWWNGGNSERENKCRERGKDEDAGTGRGFGWVGCQSHLWLFSGLLQSHYSSCPICKKNENPDQLGDEYKIMLDDNKHSNQMV